MLIPKCTTYVYRYELGSKVDVSEPLLSTKGLDGSAIGDTRGEVPSVQSSRWRGMNAGKNASWEEEVRICDRRTQWSKDKTWKHLNRPS